MRTLKTLVILVGIAVSISTTALVLAENGVLSEGYQTEETLPSGTMVSLAEGRTVKAANLQNAEELLGVVVAPDDSLISLSSGQKEAQIATGGVVQVIVSDLEGEIKPGQKLSPSPIDGVAMRATQAGRVIGTAQGSFNSTTENTIKRELEYKGEKRNVTIGKVLVLVSVSYVEGDPSKSIIPGFIENLATAVAGRQVSAVRIIISGFLLVLVLILDMVFVYGSVRGSIISIGRNPLSQASISKSLLQVTGISFAVLLVTLGAVYLILSR
jgi:hypothetical protein